jgi:hypothetical protein
MLLNHLFMFLDWLQHRPSAVTKEGPKTGALTSYNTGSPKFTPLRSVNFGRVPENVVQNKPGKNEL